RTRRHPSRRTRPSSSASGSSRHSNLDFDDPELEAFDHGLHVAADAELLVDVAELGTDRTAFERDDAARLLVRQPARDHRKDFALEIGELRHLQLARLLHALEVLPE